MRLDYLEGRPRVYSARGRLTFFSNNHRFVIDEKDLEDPSRIIRSVAQANKSQPKLGDNAIASVELIGEERANRLGSMFSRAVPTSFVLARCLALHGLALFITEISGSGNSPVANLQLYALVWACVIWHEIGHAAAATRTGIRTDGIGAGIYLIFPVLMTKVSMVAILPRRDRIIVYSSGILFQGYAALLMATVNLLLPSATIEKAIYSNAIIAMINAIPLLRFDGHHIVSELLEISRQRGDSVWTLSKVRWLNRLSLMGILIYMALAANATFQSLISRGLRTDNAISIALIVFCIWRLCRPLFSRALQIIKTT